MGFKEKKTSSYTKKSRAIPYTVGLLWIFSVFVLWISISNAVKHIDFNLVNFDQTSITPGISKIITQTPKDEKLNILIVWRWGWEHDAPDLTDTIILASIDISQASVTMLSIPRDLYVEYSAWENDTDRRWKINRLYEDNLPKWETYAMSELSSKITEITGQRIDNYINIDFDWFKEIVDVLDGIEITVAENLVDNNFPDGNLWYTTFILRKWTWNLDWDTALKYARSRYSTSDFDRSIRQQQIIKAIQDKILNLGYLKSPSKTKNLYNAIRTNIKTDLNIKTILSLASTFKSNDEKNILSFNLNDSCFYSITECQQGGFLYYPERYLFNNLSVLLAEWSTPLEISNYKKIQKYTHLIFDEAEIFEENYPINIFNSTKRPWIATSVASNLNRFWFNIPAKGSVWNIREKTFEKSILYYNGIDENSSTLKNIKDFLDIEMEEVEFPLFSDNIETNIEIVLWENYEDILIEEISY